MRQHRALDHVADGIDAGNVGLVVTVDFNAAAAIERDARLSKTETVGVGLAASGDQNHIGFQRFSCAALDRLERDLGASAGLFDRRHLGAELEVDALLGKQALRLLGQLAIHAAENVVEVLDDGDLGAEALPDGTEFETDDTAADDDELFRNLGKRDCAGRGDDDLLVKIDLNAWNACDIRTGGNHDVLGFEFLHRAIFSGDGDLAGGHDLAGALERIDLVLLEQEGHAIDIGLHHAVLMPHHLVEVERRCRHFDAEAIHAMGNMGKHFRRMQQSLGGNAANVQAGAAIGGALFDHSDLETELCSLDGANITAGAGTDKQLHHKPFDFLHCWAAICRRSHSIERPSHRTPRAKGGRGPRLRSPEQYRVFAWARWVPDPWRGSAAHPMHGCRYR